MKVFLKLDLLSSRRSQDQLALTIEQEQESTVVTADVYERIQEIYGLGSNEFVIASQTGISLPRSQTVQDSDTLVLLPTVLGGKGGFGSLIRSFGKQIAKSTNKDACRDLTGRRIKHVNEEKRIKEYIDKQAEIAQQKEEAQKERIERRRKKREYLENGARAQFLDADYVKQMDKINEDLDLAIKTATADKKRKKSSEDDQSGDEEQEQAQATTSAAACGASKTESKEPAGKGSSKATPASKPPISKNLKGWLGVDAEVSSSSEEEEEEEPVVTKKTKKC